MTLTLVPPTPPSGGARTPHAVVRFVASLSGALDGLAGTPLWSMTPEEERTVLVELRRQRARLEELELRLLVQADRDGVGADSGATSTPAWLAHATKTTTTSRHRDLHLAKKLDETFDGDPGGVGGRADRRGEGTDHRRTRWRHSPRSTTTCRPGPGRRPRRTWSTRRRPSTPRRCGQLGKRLFEVVCPEAADAAEGTRLAKEEAKARALAHFSVRDHGDGTSEGRFKLPTLHADLLKKALEALTSAAAARGGPAGPGDREEAAARDVARARADGAGGEPPRPTCRA